MALERRNPLPVGFYWQDLMSASARTQFHTWAQDHPTEVAIRSTVDRGDSKGLWVLWEVRAPVRWDGPGLPSIATATTREPDTHTRPEPEPDPLSPGGSLDILPDLPNLGGLGGTLAALGAGAALIYLFTRSRR